MFGAALTVGCARSRACTTEAKVGAYRQSGRGPRGFKRAQLLGRKPAFPPSTASRRSVAGFATKSRAAHRSRGHATSQSTSSVSTTGTTSTSVRLSQSSASSLAFDDPPRELDEKGDLAEQECRGSVEISPASALRAAKLHRRKSRDCAPAPPAGLADDPERRVRDVAHIRRKQHTREQAR
ncbi:hypothetical protein EVJ58_g758 [Rhodofomes roseus]|uniref:Uncharacterized protein n=1 Tax=Rhodofomes roseus TaxID=34475 RepID=A0A4Y9Z4R0_9APHY|nr:hypothetical protein EVJ58_g758 [Rhodofomes roseus]